MQSTNEPTTISEQQITGSEALAYGALEAGVQYVTGYPGSPSTATFDALLAVADPNVCVEWAINEKSAFDTAFGSSLAGVRSLLCLKGVGLNVALDSLMVCNLAPGAGAFVILVGDDPGGWGSQNEQDSRPLVAAAEVPLLEPMTAAQARSTMHQAFDLSEQLRVPVAVRITRALTQDHTTLPQPLTCPPVRRPAHFARQPERYNVLPVKVVEFHRNLQATLDQIQTNFEHSPANVQQGSGRHGIIAAGYAYQKLARLLAAEGQSPPLHILRLSTLNPLPSTRIGVFLRHLDAALVLEETLPFVEIQVQAIAQRAGLTLPIYGRSSGHLPGAGELFAPHISLALTALLPGGMPHWSIPGSEGTQRTMPSRQTLCEDCPYIPLLEALLAVMEDHGGRDAFVVTGETGCMVRAQLPPWEIMDLKYGMGASIGLAAGLARSGIPHRVIALSGDSALLHSGLGELIDAARARVAMLVIVLSNQTTALSGGQPHPATGHDAVGNPQQPVDLPGLIRAAGVGHVRVVDPREGEKMKSAIEEGMTSGRLAVVIAERACPRYESEIGA